MIEKHEKLERKMKWMLLSTLIPMTVLLIVLLAFFWHYTNMYNELSNNLAVSSEYNANYKNSNSDMSFKDEVDMDIYYVSIGRKGKDGLPVDQVNKAIATVEELKKTSYKKESLSSLKNLSAYLENLKKRMTQLVEIKNYNDRQEFMTNNTEILTTLFEKEMQNYIYQEATQLVEVESRIAERVRLTLLCMCGVIIITIIVLLRRSFRFTYSITKPVSEILYNIKKVGKGEYRQVTAVSADSMEIQELDEGTRKMAGKIQGLMENVKKEQEAQRLTELQLIQAQVNPHFLYNTLDTIVWLVEGGMEQDAVDMITSLSVFFRTSLSQGNDIITLAEEERHTLSYLEIQQSRYRDILEFEIRIPKGLEDVLIPKLTLQPLAENALYHGIKNKRGKGKILIEGFDLGDDMMLRVLDNGQGMTPERLHEVQEAIRTGKRAGFGLAAVSERIALYYGSGYGLKVSSSEGEGTQIDVYLAKHIKH
ncbi:MAG: sensor histidine kinase [Clostridia bacterium]|nr:sensor histidine kinase [Clostridia bacterium]MDY5554840.1 sensor histidine kinase [Blautia sp.]